MTQISQTLTSGMADERSGRWPLQLSLLAGSVLVVICSTPLAPALPKMREAFADAGALQVPMVLTIPALAIVLVAPLVGWVADRYGRKPLFIVSALLYGLVGSSGFIAQDMGTILLGRALFGVAVAGLMTSVAALLGDYFSGPARARFIGLQAAAMGIGNSLFLVLGGILAEGGWRPPFLMFLAAPALLPLFILSLYEPPHIKQSRMTNEQGAPASLSWPLLRLTLFVYILVGLSQIAFYLVPLQMPFWLRQRFATSSTESGVAIGLVAFSFALSAMVYGRIGTRVAHIPLAGLALALLGSSYLLIALAPSSPIVYAGLLLCGVALGWILPNLNLWLANQTPRALRGRLLGGFSAVIFLGHFLSPVLLQAPPTLAEMGDLWQRVGLGLLLFGLLVTLLQRPLLRLFHGGTGSRRPTSADVTERAL
ncbi:MAG: MFS transporter [Anaerolineae bacterium]|nr:MFS transporter [Anaerolineae bacterium]